MTPRRISASRPASSIRIHQIRSAMCAPLWLRERVIGVIYVDSPLHVGSFSTSDLDLLTALANYAAVAIERARLNERIRSERAARDRLERYHSPAVIEAVLGGPEHEEPSVTLRETSIMFADIVGFTARCESLPPEEVAAFLNQFFSLAADAIFEFGGTLDKFIGDAVMAFFGAPLAAGRSCGASGSCGARAHADRWKLGTGTGWPRAQDPIEVRVAIHSGPVVVGDIGSASRVDYTVLGEHRQYRRPVGGVRRHARQHRHRRDHPRCGERPLRDGTPRRGTTQGAQPQDRDLQNPSVGTRAGGGLGLVNLDGAGLRHLQRGQAPRGRGCPRSGAQPPGSRSRRTRSRSISTRSSDSKL